MPLLSPGNTEFRQSVTRGAWHIKSRRLNKLLRALAAYQNEPTNLTKLQYLSKRLTRWEETNPKEFGKRGRLAGQLREEIDHALLQRGGQVALAGAAEPLDEPDEDREGEYLAQWQRALASRFDVWSRIEITDLPTGVRGQYRFAEGNEFSEADRNKALAHIGIVAKPELDPRYWLTLGKLVLTPKLNRYYGRCFSCAAAAVYSLVMDPDFDDYMIEHIGSIDYDHHLVLLNRANANGVDDSGLNGVQHLWGDAVVIDVWQANLNRNQEFASAPQSNQYVHGQALKWFCAYPPEQRGQHRNYASALRDMQVVELIPRVLAQRGDPSVGPAGVYAKNPAYEEWVQKGRIGKAPDRFIKH